MTKYISLTTCLLFMHCPFAQSKDTPTSLIKEYIKSARESIALLSNL